PCGEMPREAVGCAGPSVTSIHDILISNRVFGSGAQRSATADRILRRKSADRLYRYLVDNRDHSRSACERFRATLRVIGSPSKSAACLGLPGSVRCMTQRNWTAIMPESLIRQGESSHECSQKERGEKDVCWGVPDFGTGVAGDGTRHRCLRVQHGYLVRVTGR